MIAIDWGTTSFRAFRLDREGRVGETRASGPGILAVPEGRFAGTLEAQVGDWLAEGDGPVVMCGMVGSRQGWREVPYVPAPAGHEDLAAALVPVEGGRIRAWIVPGVSCRGADAVPEVMRGEETQVIGVMDALPSDGAQLCLPGSHSKWVEVRARRITGWRTHLTGEVFAALKGHTILGRLMSGGGAVDDREAFGRGVARSRAEGGLLHHLFGVRSLGLFGELPDGVAASYLSGLLIGHEVLAQGVAGRTVYVVGAAGLAGWYAEAIKRLGGRAVTLDSAAAAVGLWRLGAHLPAGGTSASEQGR